MRTFIFLLFFYEQLTVADLQGPVCLANRGRADSPAPAMPRSDVTADATHGSISFERFAFSTALLLSAVRLLGLGHSAPSAITPV